MKKKDKEILFFNFPYRLECRGLEKFKVENFKKEGEKGYYDPTHNKYVIGENHFAYWKPFKELTRREFYRLIEDSPSSMRGVFGKNRCAVLDLINSITYTWNGLYNNYRPQDYKALYDNMPFKEFVKKNNITEFTAEEVEKFVNIDSDSYLYEEVQPPTYTEPVEYNGLFYCKKED